MDFEIDNHVLLKYTGNDTKITIPCFVRKIADYAFFNKKQIESVICNEGLEEIGNHVFEACKSLQAITFPDSLRKIGAHCFHYCTSLNYIELPDEPISISEGAFYSCDALISIVIPGQIGEISNGTFQNCRHLKYVKLCTGITRVGMSAFKGCSDLEKIDLPMTLKRIGEGCFACCKKLDNVIIPDGVQYIAGEVFRDCSCLKKIELPDSVHSLGYRSFDNCGFTCWEMPPHIQEIDAFFLCGDSITDLKVSSDLEEVPAEAFSECVNLRKLYIDDDITVFGGKVLSDIVVASIHISTKGVSALSGVNKLNAVKTFLNESDTYSREAQKAWRSYIRRFRRKILAAFIQEGDMPYIEKMLELVELTDSDYSILLAAALQYMPDLYELLERKHPEGADSFTEGVDTPDSFLVRLMGQKKISRLRAVHILEAAILYGTALEVQMVYDQYQPFECLNTAVCLSVQIGDGDKLKILLQNDPRITETWCFGELRAQYGLWDTEKFCAALVSTDKEENGLPTICTNVISNTQCLLAGLPSLVSGGLPTISAKQIELHLYEMVVECIPHITWSKIILAALFYENIELAKKLLACGYTVEEHDLSCFTDAAASDPRRSAFKTLARYSPEERNYVFSVIVDILDSYHKKVVFTKILLDYAPEIFDKTFFQRMCNRCDIAPLGNKELIAQLIRYHQSENLFYFLEHKKEKIGKQVLWDLIDYAERNRCPECMEQLKKYLNQYYSPETRTLDSSSASAMRKIWNYVVNEDNTITITGYKGESVDVVVPKEIAGKIVTEIGAQAFSPEKPRLKIQVKETRRSIQTVVIPETIQTIELDAFHYCNCIKIITIHGTALPNGFRTAIAPLYGIEQFQGLETSESYRIVNGIIYDNQNKMLYCPRNYPAQNFVFPPFVEAVSCDAFTYNRSIEEITVPSTVKEIEPRAFTSMEKLKKIHFGDMRAIPKNIFEYCHHVQEIVLEEGTAEIPDMAFSQMAQLKKINIPKSCTKIGKRVFPMVNAHPCYYGLFAKYEYADDFCISVYHGSYGEEYALNRNIPFEYSDE